MVAASVLSGRMQEEKAGRMIERTMAALSRKNLPGKPMTIREDSPDGKETRRTVECDFTKAANLELFDRHMIPYINELLDDLETHERTGIIGLFNEEVLYAIRELKSVTKMDIDEISEVLYPKPKIVLGQVLSFPFGK